MTIFEKRLEAALDTLDEGMFGNSPLGFRNKHAAQPTSKAPQRTEPTAPIQTSPLAKFSRAPYNIPQHLIQALMADPEDTDVFNAIAYERGKPIAGLLRRALLGEPIHRPTPDDMRD